MPMSTSSARRAPLVRRPFPLSTLFGTKSVYDGTFDKPYPRIRVQMAPGADPTANPVTWSWVDITGDVRESEGINIQHALTGTGRSPQPSTVAFTLNNQSGDYTPHFATGQYYPNLIRRMPVRVMVDYGAGDFARATLLVSRYRCRWDTSGNVAVVDIEAGGHLQRWGQGTPVRHSLLYAYNFLEPKPIAYWPLEDGSGAETLQEVTGGAGPMTWSDSGGTPTFGATGPAGAPTVATLTATTDLRGDVPVYTGTTWSVLWIVNIPSAPAGPVVIATIRSTGTIAEWRVVLTPSGGTDTIDIQGYEGSTGTGVISVSDNFVVGSYTEPYGRWLTFGLTVTPSGSDISYTINVGEVGQTTPEISHARTYSTATNGIVENVFVSSSWAHTGWSYGHIAVYDTAASYLSSLLDGYNGQAASTRIARALSYANETGAFYISGGGIEAEVGPWRSFSLLENLQDAAAADEGILHDGLIGFLTYRSLYSLYNQTTAMTVDVAQAEILPPFDPQDDDTDICNEMTVSRTGTSLSSGSSSTVRDDAHIEDFGLESNTKSLNLYQDSMTLHHAGWNVNLGTVSGFRYPQVVVDLAKDTQLAAAWCAMRPGDILAITNLPSQHPLGTVRVLVLGWTENINSLRWRVRMNCVPAPPYDVYAVGSATKGRIPTGGSTLAADVSAVATTLSIASASSDDLWTTTATYPADFPMSAMIGGEDIAITAITGTSSPQSFTVTRSVNSVVKVQVAGTAIQIKDPSPIAL